MVWGGEVESVRYQKMKKGDKVWLCRGFPKCVDVGQAKGNLSVR